MKLVILNIFASLLLLIACSSDNRDTKRTTDTSIYSSSDSLLRHMDSVYNQRLKLLSKTADTMFGQIAFGHSLEERKHYYTEMIHLERRARNYADSAIPDWNTYENQALFIKKKKEWVSELRSLYGFTEAQAGSISYESYLRNWPLPEVVELETINFKLKADQLYGEYSANEVAADMKYRGQVIEVSGPIQDIGKDILDNAYIVIGGEGFLDGVQCTFLSNQQLSVAKLSKGQHVTVKGEVAGKMGNVLVNKCILK